MASSYLIILTTIIWFKTELQQTRYRINCYYDNSVFLYEKINGILKTKEWIVFNVKKNTMVTAREGQM
jgi:hypothetical protein